MRQKRWTIAVALLALLAAVASCGKDKKENKDAGTDTDTDSDMDAGTDTDSDTDTGSDTGTGTQTDTLSQACQSMIDYFEQSCFVSPGDMVEFSAFCGELEATFTDSFMSELERCITTTECAAFTQDAGPDAGMPDAFDACIEVAMDKATPASPNLDFRAHFCGLMVTCAAADQQDCEDGFFQGDGAIWKVLDQPFIGQADLCVNPMPACPSGDAGPDAGSAVEACLMAILQQTGLF